MTQVTLQAIGRLRRSQSRNADTMLICDEYERVWKLCQQLSNEKLRQVEIVTKSECPTCEERKRQVRERVSNLRKRRAEGNK